MNLLDFLTSSWLTRKPSIDESKTCLTPVSSVKNVVWMNILYDTSRRYIWSTKINERCVNCTSWWVFNIRWHVYLEIKLGMIFVIIINWNFFGLQSWNWWTNVMDWVDVLSCFLGKWGKVHVRICSSLNENSMSLRNIIFRNSFLLLVHWLKMLQLHSRRKIKWLIYLLLDWRKRSLSFIEISNDCLCFTWSCIDVWCSNIVERNSLYILR